MGRTAVALDLRIAAAGLEVAGMAGVTVWVGIAALEASFGIVALPSDAGIGEHLGFVGSFAMPWEWAGIGNGEREVHAGSPACTGIGVAGSAPMAGIRACPLAHRKSEQFSAWEPEN